MTGSRILVVDDEQGIRDVLQWELDGQGFVVAAAANGKQALELLARDEYDLVISDVSMPGISGVEVLRSVKALAPNTEVIINTGHANLETSLECLRSGAFDLLQKPVHRDQLLSAVGRALEHRRLRAASSLFNACQVIFSSSGSGQLPDLIVDVAMKVMPADGASLSLVDAAGVLQVTHVVGAEPNLHWPEARALVLRNRNALILDDPAGAHSSIVYPLIAGDRPVGVLQLYRHAPQATFRQDDLDRATVLASQVLLALENARLLRQMVASERLASIGQLAASVAHEINNPLAYVVSSHSTLADGLRKLAPLGALIERGASADELRAAWQQAGGAEGLGDLIAATEDGAEGAKRIQEIAKDLKSLARTDEGVEKVVTDLNEVIRSATRISATEVRSRATLVQQLGTDVAVMASAGRLSQVFINLFVNAAQAMAERGGPRGKITVTTERKGQRVVARVTDTGPGIRPEHLPRLFEAFFTTKGNGAGTGLGLWLSKEIIRGLGGELRLTTELGVGTTFEIDLPGA